MSLELKPGGEGPGAADKVIFDDALTQLGAANAQEAVVAVWILAIAPQDDFSQPYNSGLGSDLGVF